MLFCLWYHWVYAPTSEALKPLFSLPTHHSTPDAGGEEHDGHAATIRCAREVRVDIQSVAGTNTGDAGDGGTVQLPTGARDQLARNLLARAATAHLRNDRPITVTVFYAWGS